MRARVTFFVLFFVAIAAGAVADEGVIHDRLPPIAPSEIEALFAATGSPAEVSADDAAPMREEPSHAAALPPPGKRTSSYSPDRQTKFEGNADYYEIFAPSISPYKRVSALDTVVLGADGVTPVLSMSSGPRRGVPVLNTQDAVDGGRVRDSFWGRVTLEFSGGTRIPLPSVSPESRVLGFRSVPQRSLRVEKDAADNFFVVSSAPLHESIAIEFLMDAPRDYFGGDIADAERRTLASFVNPLPASVQTRASRFAAEIGLDPRARYRPTLERLVEYFRAFVESEEPPRNTGDVYLDLARGKRGVCRHRAYAFVVTALAVGIPSRFVSNEAHAWVEVMTPSRTWRRIDLGGAARGLRSHQRDDVPRYDARVDDPLPRPPEYVAAYAEAARAQRNGAEAQTDASRTSTMANANTGALPATWRTTNATPETAASAQRVQVTLTLDESARTTLRGRELFVSGRAMDASGAPASQVRIEVSLLSGQGDRYLPLGVTTTEEDGRFRLSVGVPRDVPPGDYRLYVATPGDRRYAQARVE